MFLLKIGLVVLVLLIEMPTTRTSAILAFFGGAAKGADHLSW